MRTAHAKIHVARNFRLQAHQQACAKATCDQPRLVPASTAVPAAAANQQNDKHNDEKRGGIHVHPPSTKVRNAAYCAAQNSGSLITFNRSSGSPCGGRRYTHCRDEEAQVMTPAPRCSSTRMRAKNCPRIYTALTSSSPAVPSRMSLKGKKRCARAMSASLIGHSGSSTFRLSTPAVSMSLAGPRFSSESALRPFHHGIRRRGGTISYAALPSNER